MIQFPYGIADFRRIRRDGMIYVDRTAHIRDFEQLGHILVFLRPRRFGKSLWLQTLASYYDLRYAGDFDQLFGGLAIHAEPTPLRNRFFVLQWNFSAISPRGGVEQITASLHQHVSDQVAAFVSDYEGHLPAPVKLDAAPDTVLTSLLSVIRKTPYKLYLLVDEYDNFVNEVMAQDVKTYRALFDNDGPFKELFKRVKSATEGQGLEKVLLTGVSPVALNDLTSGFNISDNVSLAPDLAALCGFREREIRDLLARDPDLSPAVSEDALATMRTWYNGYRFTSFPLDDLPGDGEDAVYNPTNALYFLKHLHRWKRPPELLMDENLRTDRGKLAFLAKTTAGTGVLEHLAEGSGEIGISRLLESFSLDQLTSRLSKDPDAVASFLYYLGLLTLTDVRGRLRIPNLVVRKLFLDRLLEIYLPDLGDSSAARRVAMCFFQDGELGPLLDFFEDKLLPILSNRDRGVAPKRPGRSGSGVNEMVIKTLLLSILFDDTRYVAHSEREIERGYADLCLLVRPEMRCPGAFDILFELKLVRREQLGKTTGQQLRELDDSALRALPAVEKAFDEGRQQAGRYRKALVKERGDELVLRSYVVVAVGLERLLGEETTKEKPLSLAEV